MLHSLPNVLLRNKQGNSFVDVTASSGTGELHKGHGDRLCRSRQRWRRGDHRRVGGATPGDSHHVATVRKPWSRKRLDQPEARRRQDEQGSDWRSNQAGTVETKDEASARSIAPSAAAARSVLHRWSSILAWVVRRESSSWRSGGQLATPASALRASRKTSPSRSPSWRGATPASSVDGSLWEEAGRLS